MDELEKIIADNDVLYAVVTDVEGTRWKEYGSRKRVPYQGIINGYFPGPEGMRSLAQFLEGQILPKTISQGHVVLMISKPTDKDIVGLFFTETGDTAAKMRRGRELNAKVIEALSRKA